MAATTSVRAKRPERSARRPQPRRGARPHTATRRSPGGSLRTCTRHGARLGYGSWSAAACGVQGRRLRAPTRSLVQPAALEPAKRPGAHGLPAIGRAEMRRTSERGDGGDYPADTISRPRVTAAGLAGLLYSAYPAYAKHSEAAPEWYGYCTELTRKCRPSQCPSTASASLTPAFGWLITMEK